VNNSVQSSADVMLARLIDELTALVQSGRTPEVEVFLDQHPEHEDRLRSLLPALAALADLGHSATVVESAPALAHGQPVSGLLGDFRILRELGRGGMGIVYEAEQISLSRRVALKVLPFAGMLDERALKRFKNEAQAAALVVHPHIVPV
jgi:serine/threonine protein kinase